MPKPSSYATRAAGIRSKARRVAAAVPSEAELVRGLGPAWRKGIGERVAQAAKTTGETVSQEQLRKMVNDAVKDEARILQQQLADVTERTRKRVERIVANGLEKGQRADTIAARLEGTLGASRAKAVAQTETHRAASGATQYTFEQLGVTHKRWATERDARVRSTHARMEGQTRKVDQAFKSPSGATADYPGGFGDPAEDCLCRCVAIPGRGKRDAEWTEREIAAEWRAADTGLRRFETEALAIVARSFAGALKRVQSAARGL